MNMNKSLLSHLRPWPKLAVIAVIALLLAGPMADGTTTYAGTDADQDGIDDAVEQELMLQYAPKLFLHPSEVNKPSSVDWYLQRVSMRFHHDGGCTDDEILAFGKVTQTNLSQQSHQTKNWLCSHSGDIVSSGQSRNTRADEGFFLQPPNTDKYDETVHLGNPNSTEWPAYSHVKPSSVVPGGYDIQYWMFYPYNDSPSVASLDFNHEGDWEHITVSVDANRRFVSAYYAAHSGEGKDYTVDQLQFADRSGNPASSSQKLTGDFTHPVVYSALGTHASYATAGTQSRGGVLPNDLTGMGASVNMIQNVINLGEKAHVMNGQDFILYGGLWGEIGETDISTGPTGPAFKDSWNAK